MLTPPSEADFQPSSRIDPKAEQPINDRSRTSSQAIDQVARTASERPRRKIETERRNRTEREPACWSALHEVLHRRNRRGRSRVPACMDFAGRRTFFCKYSCRATALLCSVLCEL